MIKQLSAILCAISLIIALPAFGMKKGAYPCDLCGTFNKYDHDILYKQGGRLTHYSDQGDFEIHSDLGCIHIFCKECERDIRDAIPFGWKTIKENDPIWWECRYCRYFYHVKKKQCWGEKNDNFGTQIVAYKIKEQCRNKVFTDITVATIFPQNPKKNNDYIEPNLKDPNPLTQNPLPQNPLPQNPQQPDQPEPQPSPEPVPPATNFVIDAKIKWLGAVCVAGAVCYGAYKVYSWWKDDSEQEKEVDTNEQKNCENKAESENVLTHKFSI